MCLCPNTDSIATAILDGGRFFSQTQQSWVCVKCRTASILPAEWLEAIEYFLHKLEKENISTQFKKLRRQLRKQLAGLGGPVERGPLADAVFEMAAELRRQDEEKTEEAKIANTKIKKLNVVMFAGTRQLAWEGTLREAAEAVAVSVFNEYRDQLNLRLTADQHKLSVDIQPCSTTGSTYVQELFDRLYAEAKANLPYSDPWSVP